jgi:uroporphyrinogen III methyltransferase/synthase
VISFDPPENGAAAPRGRVVFVGAGPGDPELITLAAVTALNEAEVVLADSADLLDLLQQPLLHIPPDVLVTAIDHLTAGADLTGAERADLVRQALSGGRTVVRLVPGDPFLDGGATAEAAALVRAGVDFEVVPGVSAFTAIPEYAGVALGKGAETHLVDATGPDFFDAGDRRWGAVPTVVVRCPAGRLADLADLAEAAGRTRDEAVLVTFGGGTTEQRTHLTKLADLGRVVVTDVDATVAVIIGHAVADYSADLDWFESKPLFGWRVLVPRTKDLVSPMLTRLRSHGARVEEVPTIAVEQPRNPGQLDKAIRGLVEGRFEWIAFTSRNAVRAVRERFDDYGLDARSFSGLKVAAATAGTADSLRAWGIDPDLVGGAEATLASLAEAFPEYDPGVNPINRVFLPKADVATEAFLDALDALGWEVEEIVAYRTVRAAPPPAETREAIKQGQFDAVVFSSSSTVRNLVGIAGKPHAVTVVAAIGPATANTCEAHGLRVDVVAPVPTGVALADALAEFAARRREEFLARGEAVTRPSQRRRHRRPRAVSGPRPAGSAGSAESADEEQP